MRLRLLCGHLSEIGWSAKGLRGIDGIRKDASIASFVSKGDAMSAEIHDIREYLSGGGRTVTDAVAPADDRIQYAVGRCSLGLLLVAESAKGLCAILFGDDETALLADLRSRFPHAALAAASDDMPDVLAAVVQLVETPGMPINVALDPRGTSFQRRVWQALRAIPAGITMSYADVARRIGAPGSARPVAQACAANPLAVAIPCHRVVRNDGGLAGYRWGVNRKRELLAREKEK